MKITIFIIVLVLKSNRNLTFQTVVAAKSSKPYKKLYFKTYSKCPPQAFTQAWSLLTKLSMDLLMEFCGRSSHIVCKPNTIDELKKVWW